MIFFDAKIILVYQYHPTKTHQKYQSDLRHIFGLNRFVDMLKERNLKSKFESHNFDIQKLWAKNPEIPFDAIANNSKKIKL